MFAVRLLVRLVILLLPSWCVLLLAHWALALSDHTVGVLVTGSTLAAVFHSIRGVPKKGGSDV
jgi:hypothetical protein